MQALSAVSAFKSLMNNKLYEDTDDTLSNLKLIGSVHEEEKIHVKSLQVKPINIFTKCERIFYSEDSNLTRAFINNTIARVFNIIESKFEDKKFCINIIIDLIQSIVGIRNLQTTYKSRGYTIFCCKLDTLVQRIEERLTFYYEKNNDLFNNLPIHIQEVIKSLNIVLEKNMDIEIEYDG